MSYIIKRTDKSLLGNQTNFYVSNQMPETLGESTEIRFEKNIASAKELSTQTKAETLKTQILEKLGNDDSVVLVVEEIV